MSETEHKQVDKGFKLLAIRPLKKCGSDVLRNLREGEIYQFYNEYNFIRKNEEDIHSKIVNINYTQIIPNNFFSTDSLNINISAIVGKNGSGKSTLLELFFALIYFVSIDEGMIDEPDDELKQKYDAFRKQVKVEMFYEIDSSIRSISFDGEQKKVVYSIIEPRDSKETRIYKIDELLDKQKIFDISEMFYSIAVNYSIYGLNSKYIGSWINDLFHKNDAYQTPLVINPMRTKGKFDINDENDLLKSRLMSNVLTLNNKNELLYNQIAPFKNVVNIKFNINYDKVQYIRREYPSGMKPVLWEFKTIFRHFGNGEVDKGKRVIIDLLYSKLIQKDRKNCAEKFRDEIEKYIIKKLHKIAMTYTDYRRFLTTDLPQESIVYAEDGENPYPMFFRVGDNSFENFLIEIKKEKSHITFKLNQAINYLKNHILYEDSNSQWNDGGKFEISPLELAKRIKKIDRDNSEIINLIPPSLFNVEIEVKDLNIDDSFVIHTMSSGEQQMIHSIQSIIYHIRNINSVFDKNPDVTDTESGKKRVTYRSLNIILDEIELYYHPDFQREYISNLLFALSQVKFDLTQPKRVKNLNFLFSTHSPFILTDIPVTNILKVDRNEEGQSVPQNTCSSTFGANIYDLFRDSFFMENGFIGQFSKRKIDEVFEDLSKEKKEISDERKEEIKQIISVIGEPLIKRQLSKMYDDLYNTDLEIEAIDQQIKRLKEFKNRKKKTDNDKDK